MILPMSRIRIIGPRDRLPGTLDVLQDFGRVQLDKLPSEDGLEAAVRDRRAEREQRALRRILADATAAMELLGIAQQPGELTATERPQLARWARRARRVRLSAERLRVQRQTLEDERTLLSRYQDFLEAFRALIAQLADAQHLRVYGVTLPGADRDRVQKLSDALRAELNVEVSVTARTLPNGDTAALIAVPAAAREKMDHAFGVVKIAEVPLPTGYADQSLTQAAPRILERLGEIPHATDEVLKARASLAADAGAELQRIAATTQDRLTGAAAAECSAATRHAFAIEGWIPQRDMPRLRAVFEQRLGGDIVLEELARGEWRSDDAPVVLSNPRLFRPFETLTAFLPLPRYGSIDPTPFVAVGFPMLFGLILGDIGYGVVLAAIASVLLWRAKPPSLWNTVARIALSAAVFAIIFGVLFGELFGNLGRRWLGLRPVLFDRENAIVAAVLVAVGVGVAHTVLGLVLSMLQARSKPRVATSRAVQLAMMVLIVLALLSAVDVLPARLFGPLGITVLIGFPVLLFLEGIVAPIEFFSTLSSVLSYVRIMALGTASVLLASVANDMVGMFGSALVGVLFGLLFHLVNFAMGLFSPTIHALRLHYVEFFKQFYSPGGRAYQPFQHRQPRHAVTAKGPS